MGAFTCTYAQASGLHAAPQPPNVHISLCDARCMSRLDPHVIAAGRRAPFSPAGHQLQVLGVPLFTAQSLQILVVFLCEEASLVIDTVWRPQGWLNSSAAM